MTSEYAKMAEKSHRYFLENEKELRLEYPGRYVAITDGEVIANADKHEDLLKEIESTKYELKEVFIKHVREKGQKVVR